MTDLFLSYCLSSCVRKFISEVIDIRLYRDILTPILPSAIGIKDSTDMEKGFAVLVSLGVLVLIALLMIMMHYLIEWAVAIRHYLCPRTAPSNNTELQPWRLDRAQARYGHINDHNESADTLPLYEPTEGQGEDREGLPEYSTTNTIHVGSQVVRDVSEALDFVNVPGDR